MSKNTARGIICPVAVPLGEDERVLARDYTKLLIAIMPHLDGLFVLGSSGEFAQLTEEMADRAIEITLERAAGRLPVYVGISESSTSRALKLIRRAARAGVDYAVACSSYYYAFDNQEALRSHFLKLAEASPVPLLLYNIPQNTGINLTPASVAVLAEHQNIVGMKDSSGNMFQFQEYLELRSEKFTILQGREQLAAISLWSGADGIVSSLSNFAPQMLQRLAAAVRAGDQERALDIQREVTGLARVFDQGYWLSALKAALGVLGIGSGRPAMPLPACTPEQVATIKSILAKYRISLAES